MRCPKCQFDHPLQTTDCLKCGIVFSKYQPPAQAPAIAGFPAALAQQPAAAIPSHLASDKMAAAVASSFAASLDSLLSPELDQSPAALRQQAATEFKYRLVALPLALVLARLLTSTGFNMVANMLAMVVHECGHAITSWLAGRWAIPTFWVTMMGDTRSWFMVLLVTGVLLAGGFLAWRVRRWGWVCAAAVLLLLQFSLLRMPGGQGSVIIFMGDGGALVLATILMAAFYAPRDSAIGRAWGLRWGLLLIGALAFMHIYRLWSGPWENIPFGEIEGENLSDPSLLTTMYGWSVIQLVDRYILLARTCFVAMAFIYFWGLASAYAGTLPRTAQPAYKTLSNHPQCD